MFRKLGEKFSHFQQTFRQGCRSCSLLVAGNVLGKKIGKKITTLLFFFRTLSKKFADFELDFVQMGCQNSACTLWFNFFSKKSKFYWTLSGKFSAGLLELHFSVQRNILEKSFLWIKINFINFLWILNERFSDFQQ